MVSNTAGAPSGLPPSDHEALTRADRAARERVAATQEEPVQTLEDYFASLVPPPQPPAPCRGGCGALLPGGGVCPACWERQASADAVRADVDRQSEAFKRAMGGLHGVTFGSAKFGAAFPAVAAKAVQAARDAVSLPRVVVVGPPLAGKTVLAAAMLHARFRHTGHVPLLASARRLSGRHGKEFDAELEEMLDARHVLLDAVGDERDRQWSSVPDFVDLRGQRRHRSLWITTRLPQANLVEAYDFGTAKKLFDHAVVIDLYAALNVAPPLLPAVQASTPPKAGRK